MSFELEMPSVALDQVVLDDSTTTPVVLNRNPEPLEDQVPAGTLIAVDVSDVGSDGLATGSIEIDVNGVLAYDNDGGGFQTGFNGPGSTTSVPDADTLRVVIDPTTDFQSLQIVTVRVRAETLLSPVPDSLDTTYQFVVEDLTPPLLVSAFMREPTKIRATFSEGMKQQDATASDDALNPANYSVKALEVPAVTAAVTSVATITDREVELTLDIPISFRKRYELTAVHVVDLFDNQIPNDTVEFLGFDCPRPSNRRFEVFRLLAQINRDDDVTGDLERFTAAIQDIVELLLCETDHFFKLFDVDIAPEAFVDLTLQDLGNPFAFADLDLVEKRKLARTLVRDIYLLKGTAAGIVNAIKFFLGFDARVVPFTLEGWELDDTPVQDVSGDDDGLGIDTILLPSSQFNLYAFNVEIDLVLIAEQRSQVTFIVDLMKPAHTHLVEIVTPAAPTVFDHLELGESELGINWELH